MMAGCYTLDLYCDADNEDHKRIEFPQQFTGWDRSEAFAAARKRGWSISPKRQLCPLCSGKRKAREEPTGDADTDPH